MSENKKNNEELNIKIDISFVKKIKKFFSKINVKDKTKRVKNANIKKNIYIIIVTLIIIFIANIGYNKYFYYKIPTIGEDNLKVFKDEEVNNIIYFNSDAINNKKITSDFEIKKLFVFGGDFINLLNFNRMGKINSSFAGFSLKKGKIDKDEILKEVSRAGKKDLELNIKNIGNLSLFQFGNLDGEELLYSTKQFNEINKFVSNKTIIALYLDSYAVKRINSDFLNLSRYDYDRDFTETQLNDLLNELNELFINNLYLVIDYSSEEDILNFKIVINSDDELTSGDIKKLSNIIKNIFKNSDSEIVDAGLRLSGNIESKISGTTSSIDFEVKGFKKFLRNFKTIESDISEVYKRNGKFDGMIGSDYY